jgi:RalA-binding protein 1
MENPSYRMLSRESRISLPDEAKQYIANMGESPVPSPKPNDAYDQSQSQPFSEHPQKPSIAIDPSPPPPPYPIDQLTDGESPATALPSSSENLKGRISEETSESEFLDMDDDDDGDVGGEEDGEGDIDQPPSYGRNKPRAVVEDFP